MKIEELCGCLALVRDSGEVGVIQDPAKWNHPTAPWYKGKTPLVWLRVAHALVPISLDRLELITTPCPPIDVD